MSEHRLSEISIERPRGGMRISLKKTKGYKKRLQQLMHEAAEDGFLRPYLLKPRNKSKYLSDHLNPLRRFLRSHIGQSWNAVYSKLCQRLSSNTLAGQHVRSHIWDFVEVHVEMIDGVPHRKASSWYGAGLLMSYYRDRFYVHPETGLLCLAPKDAPKRPQRQQDILMIDGYRQYHRIGGLWYLITYREFPDCPVVLVFDILKGAKLSRKDARQTNGKKMYAASKKQCGKKEIRLIQQQLSSKV